ncbi:MAG: tetratricopeptide repeat protein [Planctomycetota bacterium]|nr:tetratricopeptide repeat protein [Planctomycetota bacterium]
MTTQQAIDLGIDHHRAGRLSDAEGIYRQVLALEPNNAQAIHLLGLVAYNVGRNDVALQLMQQAVAIDPALLQGYGNMGLVLAAMGRGDEAIAVYRHALSLQPDYTEAMNNLGVVLYERKELAEAIACYRRALAIKPDYDHAINNLGNALSENGQVEEAFACYERVIKLSPNYADAYNNMGDIFVERNRLDDAIGYFQKACALRPDYAEAFSNLGNVMYRKCRMEEAVAYNRRAIALKPDLATAHWNLGLALLCRGEFPEGWREYAWRTRVRDMDGSCREFSQPLWDGGALGGRTILLHAEQGIGDSIQFIRYLPQVKAKGGKIMIDCGRPLMRLFQQSFAVDQWVCTGEPIPEFDVHCPLMSLPMVLGTTIQNIPAEVPYLLTDAKATEHWRQRTGEFQGLKVGVVWAGRPEHGNDRNRSMSLSTLAPLADVPGITFFSLQKGEPAAQARDAPAGMRLIDYADELEDFADTAALVANLDLVISVDTSVVHLAGALGKPVWALLPFWPDWRWMVNRSDSPWYPTLRLFRQRQTGDWNPPISEALSALRAFMKAAAAKR